MFLPGLVANRESGSCHALLVRFSPHSHSLSSVMHAYAMHMHVCVPRRMLCAVAYYPLSDLYIGFRGVQVMPPARASHSRRPPRGYTMRSYHLGSLQEHHLPAPPLE